jgi:hypothetical protein
MAKPASPPRPLIEAAEKLDASLAEHGRAARELLKLGLDSRKGVEKSAEALSRIAGHEQELSADMQRFVGALATARDTQQADAEQVQARALELVARRGELEALDGRLRLLADAVRAVGALIEQLRDSGGGGAGVAEAVGKLGELGELARGVSEDARRQGFADVADEGHALRQQLEAVVRRAEALEKRVPRA